MSSSRQRGMSKTQIKKQSEQKNEMQALKGLTISTDFDSIRRLASDELLIAPNALRSSTIQIGFGKSDGKMTSCAVE